MKKRWKIFWIVCGSMFLIGIICCSVSWGMGTTLTDIAISTWDQLGIRR